MSLLEQFRTGYDTAKARLTIARQKALAFNADVVGVGQPGAVERIVEELTKDENALPKPTTLAEKLGYIVGTNFDYRDL